MLFPTFLKFCICLSLFLPVALAQDAPTLTKLFDGTVFLDTSDGPTVGPFGTRTLIRFNGGSLIDPSNGSVVANIIPGLGGELGVISANGFFYTDVRAGLQWVDDATYGFLELHGSGKFGVGATSYARFETDSAARAELNGLFTFQVLNTTTSPATFQVFVVEGGLVV